MKTNVSKVPPYFSPNDLSERWRVSRSSVDRIARDAGLTRLCLGDKKNSSVRYSRKEVIAYEKVKKIKMSR